MPNPSLLPVRTGSGSFRSFHLARGVALFAGSLVLGAAGTTIYHDYHDYEIVSTSHEGLAEHLNQFDLLGLVEQGLDDEAFELAFEHGDELFETDFNVLDGGGANVGDGQRYTRIPRADLNGEGEWANHVPSRATGPNGQSCLSCHNTPFDDGAGQISGNVHRDPFHTGSIGSMINRSAPHMFAPGAVQRLAEEMTAELQAQKEELKDRVRETGRSHTQRLQAKGVDFGKLYGEPSRYGVHISTRYVEGVAEDLVVRPFDWKGSTVSLRDFNRGAGHNEIGMQAVEIAGDDFDGDGDGIVNELTVGDITALSVYLAAQPRPVTKVELSALGLIEPLNMTEMEAIHRGEATFEAAGCAECHVPSMELEDAMFREPSNLPDFRDEVFPAGQNPEARGVKPEFPVSFDLTHDQPDNVVMINGSEVHLGSLPTRGDGTGAVVSLYGDLKRHRMGYGLAESIDEAGTGKSSFLTENLWGVGSTAPYMHDGRATTLTEAILEHGGDARDSRNAFVDLSDLEQMDLIAFLNNLVLFKIDEEATVSAAARVMSPSGAAESMTQRRSRKMSGR